MSQTVLIVGGTNGIGLELVKLYISNGSTVVYTGRDNSHNDLDATFVKIDMLNIRSIRECCKKLRSYTFDLVFMVAGMYDPTNTIEPNGLSKMFMVNFFAHAIILKSLANSINGLVTLISSPASMSCGIKKDIMSVVNSTGTSPHAAYGGTKLLLNVLAHRLWSHGIQSIAISPGHYIDTQMLKQTLVQKIWHNFTEKITPIESAQLIYGLVESSDECYGKYISHNGTVINADECLSQKEILKINEWLDHHINDESHHMYTFSQKTHDKKSYMLWIIALIAVIIIGIYWKCHTKNSVHSTT